MAKNRKVLLTVLSVALIAIIGIFGTIAYLTDTDSQANVMTMGKVDIEQHEFERVVGANGEYTTITVDGVTSYELQEFTQAKPLLPYVGEVNNGYDPIPVRLAQLGHNSRGGMDVFPAENVVDKFVVVENTGRSDAYVRTLVAFEAGSLTEEEWCKIINYSSHFTWKETQDWFVTNIDGNNYYMVEFVYNGYQDIQHPNGVVPAGDYTYNSLAQVYMFDTATNDDIIALDGNNNGTYDILVLSQAVQADGFADAKTALDTAFGTFNEENVKTWFGGTELPATVDTAEELAAALAAGGKVVLEKDLVLDGDNTMTVAAGKNVELDLNGKTITAEADGTGNRDLFLVKGNMIVTNGDIELTATVNQGWGAMAAIFDVTAGGVLNMEGVDLKVSGTDMTFGVHLNNWGEVTLNMNNCVVDSNYCAVRVFNSGFDKNNVTIENSTLKGATRAFWVHNYIGDLDSSKHSDEAIKARLNLDIFGNNNTFELSGTAKAPIRYGFDATVYYDANGNVVE